MATTHSEHVRQLDTVLEDMLWPQPGICPDPEIDLRHLAVAEVLCRIPEPDYQKLTERIDDFHWFIPHQSYGAMVFPFPWTMKEEGFKPFAAVLFLSPAMERWGFDVIVATVAHELAHIFLRHTLFHGAEQNKANESEAWCLIRSWGFEHEERKHKAFYAKRSNREKAQHAALVASFINTPHKSDSEEEL